MTMRNLMRIPVLALLLAGARLVAGPFTVPLVDLQNRITGTAASLAVWSTLSVSFSAGATLTLQFPADFAMNGVTPSTCGCLFTKFTDDSGHFSAKEVSITAGSLSGQSLEVVLPEDCYPGDFYIRLDAVGGVVNPPNPGLETLVLSDASGDALQSRGFWIQGTAPAADPFQASLTGVVTDLNGQPVAGAYVDAVTLSPTATSLGPSLAPTPQAVGDEQLATITDANGKYAMMVPLVGASTTYYVVASYSRQVGPNLKTYQTPQQTVVVNGSTTTANLSNPWIYASQIW